MAASADLPTRTLRIRTNRLLEGAEQTMTLEQGLLMAALYGIDADDLRRVHDVYGPGGVYRFVYLANTHQGGELDRFTAVILALAHIQGLPADDIALDNDELPQGDAVERFNHNVLQPSIARKLYNPGRHPGYLVYGVGGPKILVSHPFRGAKGELYDPYVNTGEVMSRLLLEGYSGAFLLLDNLRGLNYEVNGAPAWLAWFSLIAAHSDIVLFLKQRGGHFSASQREEIAFTPDRVQKKIVEIDALTWVDESELDELSELPVMYVGGGGTFTEEEFGTEEARHAGPLIELYAEDGIPHDQLYRLDEDGQATAYPLDYPVYG